MILMKILCISVLIITAFYFAIMKIWDMVDYFKKLKKQRNAKVACLGYYFKFTKLKEQNENVK